jgi:hypothetical protein
MLFKKVISEFGAKKFDSCFWATTKLLKRHELFSFTGPDQALDGLGRILCEI